ncbi:MAG: amino acid racemase [Syntrophobacteraceae bacterium]
MEKVIGVLGGMGPEATLYFYRELIVQTPARTDHEHLRVIIDSNPKVPDRIQAILHGGESPVPALAAGAAALEHAGADFIVIPCISAHFFLDDLRERTNLPVFSIFDIVAEHIAENHPGVHILGLLGTTGTVQGGLFQERLSRTERRALSPEPGDQLRITSAIHDIKDALSHRTRKEIALDVCAVARRLVERGAQGIIAGCTEIPLVLDPAEVPVPVFNPLKLLARAAIIAAKEG